MRNKADMLADRITDTNIDIVAITETWLSTDKSDDKILRDLTLAIARTFVHISRPNQKQDRQGRRNCGGRVYLVA